MIEVTNKTKQNFSNIELSTNDYYDCYNQLEHYAFTQGDNEDDGFLVTANDLSYTLEDIEIEEDESGELSLEDTITYNVLKEIRNQIDYKTWVHFSRKWIIPLPRIIN